jgi:polyhydroxybutyrate depolymerase
MPNRSATATLASFVLLVALGGCAPGPSASTSPVGSTSTIATLPAASIASPVTASPPAGSDVSGSLESGGQSRTYLLHLPPAATRLSPTPLVMAFHGWPMTAQQMSSLTRLSVTADAHGFAVVFPQGVGNSWSVPGGLATPAQKAGIDDVAFVRALLETIVPQYQLDPNRVVATGISNGGHLAEALGCAVADRLAAIAPVAAPLRGPGAACKPVRAVTVLEIVGTDDIEASGFPNTLTFWSNADKCSEGPATSSPPSSTADTTSVTIVSFTGCAGESEVTGYLITGGGHTWPGGRPLSTEEFGVTSRQIDASELIWSLLSRQS